MAKANMKKKITITEEGLKLNQEMGLAELTDMTMKGLLSVYVSQKDKENEDSEKNKELYNQLYVCFMNCLAFFGPSFFFPSLEEIAEDEAAMSELASTMPDISEAIEAKKEAVKSRMSFTPEEGESVTIDDNGHMYFMVDEEEK